MYPDPDDDSIGFRVWRAWRWLADGARRVGAALVWPIEWVFHSIAGTVFAATERSEDMEDALLYLGWIATWPFRMIWRLSAAVTRLFFPQAVRNLLSALGRVLSDLLVRFGWFLMWAFEALNLDGLVFGVVWLTQPIWRPVAAVGGFFGAWAASRDYRQALWGLPVVILLLPFGLILVRAAVFGNSGVASQYRLAVKEALEEGDYARATLFERKLAQLGVDTRRSSYQTAMALAREGDAAGAYKRMQRLAPVGQPGYPAAHFWIIQNLMAGNLDVPPDEAHRLVGIHLDQLQSLGFRGPDTQLVRAIWLDQEGKPAEAAATLEPFVARVPEAAIERMRIHLEMNLLEEARADARLVRDHLNDRQRQNNQLTSYEFKSWALAEGLLGDVRKLKSIVQNRLKHEPEDLEARRTLAVILRSEFEKNLRSARPDAKTLANLLLDITELSEKSDWVSDQVTTLYTTQDLQPVAKAVVERVLQSERSPSVVLISLGAAAVESNEWYDATRLFQRATVIDPTNPVVWNNYAWVLSNGASADHEEALRIVGKALELQPDHARLRETRGQILVSLKRWRDAIEDLEFASNGMPDSQKIHKSLATAYAALGNEELARVHLELSQ